MESRKITSKIYCRNLQIITVTQVLSVLLFMFLALWQKSFIIEKTPLRLETITKILVFFALMNPMVGNFFFKRKLQDKMARRAIKPMLLNYNTAIIIRYALLEFAALFGVIVFYLNSNPLAITISILVLLIMLFLVPTRNKIITHLEMDGHIRKSFEDPDEELYFLD